MNEQERAEEHLRTIRRLMERGTIYRAISAPTALVGGLLSLAASGIWMAGSAPGSKFHPGFLPLWLAVLLLTAGTNTLMIILGARKRKEPVFSASMKAAFTALAPPFLVAAVLTLIPAATDWNSESGGALLGFELGLVWAICYGLGLLATGHFAPRSLVLLGWAFLISGLATPAALYFAGGSPTLDIRKFDALFMAATFGLFHLIYALCAWPRKGDRPEP